MFGDSYEELKFKTYAAAKQQAVKMKMDFGYMPEIFEVKDRAGKHYFAVIKPFNLEKIR